MPKTLKPLLIYASFLWFSASSLWAEDFQRWSALPILGYSEETEWQFGALALFFFKPGSNSTRGSSLDFAAYATTRKQFQAVVSPDIYLFQGRFHANLDFVYWDWVARYYGIGNNPDVNDFMVYDMTRYSLRIPLEMSLFLPPSLSFLEYGAIAHVEYNEADFNAYEGGLNAPSSLGGWRTGLGYSLALDTRDHPYIPTHGYYAYWEQMFYNKVFGGPAFVYQTIDLRAYAYLFWRTSLALGAIWQSTFGDVPFDMLAMPDGSKRFRGIERGLFRDKQSFVWQAELRRPLFWRLGGAIFYEAAKVGPYFSELYRERWHHAFGFGGRLALNTKEGVYARCDFSLVDGKYFGLTIYIREAF